MKAAAAGVALVVSVGALALGGWLFAVDRAQSQRVAEELAELRTEVAEAREEAAAARLESAVAEQRPTPDPRVAALQATVRRMSDPSHRLVPRGASVVQRQQLTGGRGEPHRVAVAWSTDTAGLPERSGVFVWEPAGGAVAAPGVADDWQLAFGVNLVAGKRVTVGSASAATTAASDLLRAGIADVGDVTGDGYRDVLTFEDSTGSGGCGTWRVVAATGGSVQQVFERTTCEADLSIDRAGLLRVRQAFQPAGCRNIHGCAIRTTVLRFDAGEWVRVSRRVAKI
jgi:hypothetical protein